LAGWRPATKPHGSALDAQGNRLFVVGANGKLVSIDLKFGKVTSSVDIAAKVDQIAYDAELKRVYCASGEGVISVAMPRDAQLKIARATPRLTKARIPWRWMEKHTRLDCVNRTEKRAICFALK